jgi:hypothetical protein
MDLLSVHSEPFSATWPTSGMTRDGVAYELPTPVLPTVDSVSSSLPTPRASRGASGAETMYALGAERSDENRPQGQVLLKTPTAQIAVNGGSQHPDKRREGGHGPTLADEVEHLLPSHSVPPVEMPSTSTIQMASALARAEEAAMTLLPTPQVADVTGGHKTRSGKRSNELLLPGVAEALTLLPTPSVSNQSGNATNNRGELLLPGVAMALVLLPTPLTTTADGVQELERRLLPGGVRTPQLSDAGSSSSDE